MDTLGDYIGVVSIRRNASGFDNKALVDLLLKYPRRFLGLSPDIYALHTAGAQGYIEAANYMLLDKFLYGSAYPCVDLESSVTQYLAKLRSEVVENIIWKNAARFLGLPE